MRISFDMDHTLVPHDERGCKEAEGHLWSGDLLRRGAVELLKDLGKNHELWIYTTSFRKQWVLKFSFWLKGVKIKRVINEQEHQEMVKTYYANSIMPSKFPKHYGIEVHIDDSVGVLQEGEKFGFRVIQIDPEDENWTDTIKSEIDQIKI